MRLFVLIVLLAACEEEPYGRSDVIPVHAVPFLEPHSAEVLAEAEDILGMEFEFEPIGAGGAVVLFRATSEDGRHSGGETYVHSCAPVAWALDIDRSVAHEVGHALGLDHVDDPDNLMWPRLAGSDLTEDQIDTMRLHAWYLLNKCEN
jgi:hypothetical protein